MEQRRYVVTSGTRADPIVEVYDRVLDERFSQWANLLPATDTEWPAAPPEPGS